MTSRTVPITTRHQPNDESSVEEALLAWYRPRRGAYPWRGSRDPYPILVSEVMLQQTQAARVAPAFERFLSAFPTVEALAAASRAEVIRTWEGLGYNRRAVALSEAARAIVRDHDGSVPSDPVLLGSLSGVGPYTAAAVASLAFGRPVAAVDTNVRRIVSRVHLGIDPDAASPARVRELAEDWTDRRDPGTWNQALMDLGRQVCRPRPRCSACPLADGCRYLASGVSPRASGRRQGPFEGSSRQVRGAVVRFLCDRSSATLGSVVSASGFSSERVLGAIRTLHRDGLITAGPKALAGRPGGRIRLAV
jgi:A/G-specific adenine glycosylase